MHELKDRHKKGSVAVITSNGSLQLRFNHAGKRRYLSLGLSDNPVNRQKAEFKAYQIEEDIFYDRLDITLAKYKAERVLAVVHNPIPAAIATDLVQLWAKYCEVKKSSVAPGTWKNGYLVMTRHLDRCLVEKSLDLDNFAAIYDWAVSNLTSDTARRLIMYLCACCDWAKRHKLIKENPFEDMEKIKVKKHSNEDHAVNPFTKEERDLIINAFSESRYYNHYAPFVKFLFYTGCRPSEAIALQWKHISKSKILFERVVVDSVDGLTVRQGLKTQQRRDFPLSSQLQDLLDSVKSNKSISESLVFPSPKGGWIDIHNFRNRAWKNILSSLDIEYRKPYQTRHTFISQQKVLGVEDDQLAKACGTSISMIHKHYAGTIK